MPRTTTQPAAPVTIPDAGVEFVFVGPRDEDRAVIAQSHRVDLLLLGMARASAHHVSAGASPGPSLEASPAQRLSGLYEDDPGATLYAVTAVVFPPDRPDAREVPYTFAWLGRSPDADLQPVLDYFDGCVLSLASAARDEDAEEKVRWQLAPLLLLCAKWTKTSRSDPRAAEERARREITRQGQRSLLLAGLALALGLAALALALLKSS